MNHDAYLSLVNDTLTYIKNLLPCKEKPIVLPKITLPPHPKPKTSPPEPKPILTPPPPPPSEPKKKEPFERELPTSSLSEPIGGIQKVLQKIAPDLYLHSNPPSDDKAKRIKGAWK